MNKTLKTVLLVALVLGVFLIAAFATGKKSVESITLEEYKNVIKKEAIVYYGKDDSSLKDIADKYDLNIKFLDSTKEKNRELKEGTLYVYNKGKETYSYSEDLNSYKLAEGLMKHDLTKRTYLTVTLDEYKKIKDAKGYHFMFIGRETCSYCTKFKESINKAMQDYDFMVYYIDTDTFKSEDEFNELVATDSYMSEEEWGTPLNLLYKDGKRVNVLNGFVEADELIKFLKDNKVVK